MSTTSTRGVLLLLIAAQLQAVCRADLRYGFYGKTCPGVEALVQKVVFDSFNKDDTVAAGLIRLYFHDCFVRGCDGSILIDSTPGNHAEKDADRNKRLHGFEVIDAAKAEVEELCPGVVSCADILAFAARESVALAGNFFYELPAGRRDGTVSREAEVVLNIPASNFDAAQLIESFAAKNLTPDDLVTLSGGHSLGVAHCTAFKDRLYAFSRASDTDPTLSPAYAALLRQVCPANSSVTATATATTTSPNAVWLDLHTPTVLDNKYYAGLQEGFSLLGSDQALLGDPHLSAAVEDNARDAKKWGAKFREAMVKMGNIVEMTENEGEIRTTCRAVNGRLRRLAAGS